MVVKSNRRFVVGVLITGSLLLDDQLLRDGWSNVCQHGLHVLKITEDLMKPQCVLVDVKSRHSRDFQGFGCVLVLITINLGEDCMVFQSQS